MPPTQRITKEMILEAGFQLVRKSGIEAVNSRNIAKALSCSTQPVFSCFATMEELRKGVFDYACKKFVDEVLQFANQPDQLPQTTRWYINLMRNEPYLYKMLYFSSGFDNQNIMGLITGFKSNDAVIQKMKELYSLDESTCRDILLRVFSCLHGIGSLIVFNNFEISDDEIAGIIKRTAADMVQSATANRDKENI